VPVVHKVTNPERQAAKKKKEKKKAKEQGSNTNGSAGSRCRGSLRGLCFCNLNVGIYIFAYMIL